MQNKASALSANIIAMLSQSGVTHAFGSPGSRNLPLLTAIDYNSSIILDMIIDERQSAFFALGWGIVKGQPPLLCCTSGSAILNYLPALSEAWYQRIKMIVLSADRPADRLNQGEPQMIDQNDALKPFVAYSADINDYDPKATVIRKVSEALEAMEATNRPVHLNVRFSEPFTLPSHEMVNDAVGTAKITQTITSPLRLTTEQARAVGAELASPCRVLLYIGSSQPDAVLVKAVNRLSSYQNIVVIAESISNLHGCTDVIYGVESILNPKAGNELSNLRPDVLITIGGTPTGRLFREFVAKYPPKQIWRVGDAYDRNELFGRLDRMILSEPALFVRQLASALYIHRKPSDYTSRWQSAKRAPLSERAQLMKTILEGIPKEYNVALSNGLTVRYATLFPPAHHRYIANRGVNGIDGTTATAMGASMAADSHRTVLITGDMSAQYDLGAFFNPWFSGYFRMIIIDNSGGGIFRRIKPSKTLPERERLACCSHICQPLARIAEAAGFVVTVTTCDNLDIVDWMNTLVVDRPQLLIIKTPVL